MAPWPLWLTSWLYAGHRPEREQGRPDLSRGSFLTRLRSADGEDTGDAARVQCKALLVPGGAYATYDNSELVCRHYGGTTGHTTAGAGVPLESKKVQVSTI